MSLIEKLRPKTNRDIEKLERRLAEINRGLLAYFELGREAYRIKRKAERKLRKLRASDRCLRRSARDI